MYHTLTRPSSENPSPRPPCAFNEEAVLHCRAGVAALHGKLYEQANTNFRKALALNPMLWEAFEGLCAIGASERARHGNPLSDADTLGTVPVINDLFHPRPHPIRRTGPEEPSNTNAVPAFAPNLPVATGMGFFTPSPAPQAALGNIFRAGWKPDSGSSQPFRIDPSALVVAFVLRPTV
jgi:anaphase-promoting complex subunit 3